jgi:hypothetical protein
VQKKFVLHLIVVPQLSIGWQHNCSTKTRQVGQANEQISLCILLCPCPTDVKDLFELDIYDLVVLDALILGHN